MYKVLLLTEVLGVFIDLLGGFLVKHGRVLVGGFHVDIVLVLALKGIGVGSDPDSVVGPEGAGLAPEEHEWVEHLLKHAEGKGEVGGDAGNRVPRVQGVDMNGVLVLGHLGVGLDQLFEVFSGKHFGQFDGTVDLPLVVVCGEFLLGWSRRGLFGVRLVPVEVLITAVFDPSDLVEG